MIKRVGDLCGPALEEHGGKVVEAADVPGWRDYDSPELDGPRRYEVRRARL